MDQIRYKAIKEKMPSSIMMELEHIKRYLDDNKASVMVGSGFSKNAIIPDFVEMKDWNELGKVFFELLYSHSPKPEELEFRTPLRLASQVQASFGRAELNKCIQRSLPDDAIAPGELHKELLKLKWRDVFTTNYDTLLERACHDSGIYYNIVTNKDTLLYEKHPRIVKLHGSFPDIHPYIITEKDYRTYPERYPAFVNTVRQALIESLFCLIGFSGDDPNFLSWLGWLQDVMKDSISPVYLITYNKNLHESEYSLLNARKIKILNLHNIPGVKGYQEALSFFFEYMQSERSSSWTGYVKAHDLKTVDDIDAYTNEMCQVRLSYPGWLFLPDYLYDKFLDITSGSVAFLKPNQIPNLTMHKKLRFMSELNWRLQMSLQPFRIGWLETAVKELSFEDDEYEDNDLVSVIDLKIALLRNYKEDGDYEAYESLEMQLQEYKEQFTAEQRRLFFYENALYLLSRLELNSAEDILSYWVVNPSDYIGSIWKSRIMLECGHVKESIMMLNMSLREVQSMLLGNGNNSPRLKSAQTVLQSLLCLAEQRRSNLPIHNRYMDSYVVVKKLKDDLLKARERKEIAMIHDFRINRVTSQWSIDSGYRKDFLSSYRYIRLQELAGLPIGLPNIDINTDDKVLFIQALAEYMPAYAVGLVIRSNNSKVEAACFNRKLLANISSADANALFDMYWPFVENLAETNAASLKNRVFRVVIPLLSKLTTRVSQDRVLKLSEKHVFLYKEYNSEYKKDLHSLVIQNIDDQHLSEAAKSIYETPIGDGGLLGQDVCLLETDYNIEATDRMIECVRLALDSDNKEMLSFAYSRLCNINEMKLSEEQRIAVKSLVHLWRNKTNEKVNKRYSLRLEAYDETVDIQSLDELLQETLLDYNRLYLKEINSSIVFDELEELFLCLSVFSKIMSSEQHIAVFQKFMQFLQEHNEELSTNDSNELMGGFRTKAIEVWLAFEEYLKGVQVNILPDEMLTTLYSLIKEYSKYGFPYLFIMSLFETNVTTITESKVVSEISKNIANHNNPVLMRDSIKALVNISKKQTNIQSVIGRVVSYIEFSQDSEVKYALDLLVYLAKHKKYNQKTQNRIYSLLNRLYENLQSYNIPIEYICDIKYYSLMLAAAIKSNYGARKETDVWEAIYQGESEFMDVKLGFEKGLKPFYE